MTIKHNCEKQGCYLETLPNWAMLKGCFYPTSVEPSDGDGIVHQNGRCLFLEKKFPRGLLQQPQVRTIDSLVAQGNSAIAFWCEDSLGRDISHMRVWGITGYDSRTLVPATLEDFRNATKAWWRSVYVRGKV